MVFIGILVALYKDKRDAINVHLANQRNKTGCVKLIFHDQIKIPAIDVFELI